MAPITTRINPNPPGSNVARYVLCLLLARRDSELEARALADRQYPDSPLVAEALRQKAFVGAATTSNGGAPLAQDTIASEFWTLLATESAGLRLLADARRVPFKKTVDREIGAGAGASFVGEGLPRPMVKTASDQFSLVYREISTISTFTRESFEFSAIGEATARAGLTAAVKRFVDDQMFNPSNTSTATNPGSLTSVGTPITSAGNSAANVVADLESLVGAIESPGATLRFLMRPTTFARLAAKLAGVGMVVNPSNLIGIPCILASTLPAHQITLVDAATVATAYDPAISIDVTTTADVEMLDSSLVQDGVAGTGTTMVSLWQAGLAAVRATLGINWEAAYFNSGSPSQASGISFVTGLGY